MRMSPRLPPAALLVLACALWGGATVLSKALLASIPPVSLLVLQLAPSAAILWLAFRLSGRRAAPATASVILPLVLLGLLNPGISYTLSLMGLARVSASVSTLLWAAEPLMILGLAAIVLREPVTPRLLAVMLASMLGVSLVADALGGFAGNDAVGVLLLLCGVLCCAFYTVFSRRLSETVDSFYIVALQQAAGLAWAVALLFAGTPYGSPADIADVPLALAAVAGLSGILYYAAAYWLYIAALRSVPAAVAGSYFNVIPVFGVTLAFIFLGERLTAVQWAGAAIILVSVFELVRLTARSGTRQSG